MTLIEFKIWPEHAKNVRAGLKPFEVRHDKKDAMPGDIMWLREWDPDTEQYTGKESRHKIGIIIEIDDFYIIGHDTNSPAEFIDLGPAQIKAGRIAQTFGQADQEAYDNDNWCPYGGHALDGSKCSYCGWAKKDGRKLLTRNK